MRSGGDKVQSLVWRMMPRVYEDTRGNSFASSVEPTLRRTKLLMPITMLQYRQWTRYHVSVSPNSSRIEKMHLAVVGKDAIQDGSPGVPILGTLQPPSRLVILRLLYKGRVEGTQQLLLSTKITESESFGRLVSR